MRTQLVVLAILAMLFSVELSGCTDTELVTIKKIREHPEYYINQTVMIQGMYSVTSIMDDSGYMIEIYIPDSVIKPIPFRPGLHYTFTGMVVFGKISAQGNDVLFLEVKTIEPIV